MDFGSGRPQLIGVFSKFTVMMASVVCCCLQVRYSPEFLVPGSMGDIEGGKVLIENCCV